VVVYGVEIPGQEGKAGMAAITKSHLNDIQTLSKCLDNDLASFAKPMFIRLVDKLEHTGNYLLLKCFL
jgi:hypothetical protein